MTQILRSSELDRRISCPGSLTIEPLCAERESDDGANGTLLHEITARRICVELGAEGDGHIAASPTPPANDEWLVDFCVREVRDNAPSNWALMVEQGFAYEFAGFILSGHIDCVALSPDGTEAIGWDWKTGYNPVDPAETNEQVLGYVMLLFRAYPALKKVTFKIVQPRNDEDEGFERISEVTINPTQEMLQQFENRINAVLANPLLLSTGKHCRFCNAALQCPAIILLRQSMKTTLTPEAIAAIASTPDDGVLGDWIVDAKALAGPIDDAKKLAHKRLDEQGYIDSDQGVRITQKIQNGSYEYPDRPGFYRELQQLIPNEAARAEALSFSVTRTKDVIAKVMDVPKTGKSDVTAEKVFDAKFRPLVIQGTKRILQFS